MFLLNPRAGDATDRSPWGDFWFSPLGGKSASGMPVTTDTALTLGAVYRAVALISAHVAMMPLVLKQTGTNKRVTAHPLLKLFRKPNPFMSGFDWRRACTAALLLRGNAYNEIVEDRRGNITALLPIYPDNIKRELINGGADYRYTVRQPDGSTRTLPRASVWHMRGLTLNGIDGVGVIEAARESFGGALAAQTYGSRYFANDARPTSGWIGTEKVFTDKTTRELTRETLQQAQSDRNRGKMMVLDAGWEYHDVAISNADAQFLESRKFGIDEVARWFGIPPHKLASLDRATFSNIEQQSLEYVLDGLLPWAVVWETGAADTLLFDSEDLEPELDAARLLRGDSNTRYNNYKTGVLTGFLTRNEARQDDGREPIEGLDAPLRPLNMVEEGEAEDHEEDLEEQEPSKQETDEPPEAEPEESSDDAAGQPDRLRALLEANAGRLARRIAKAGHADPAIVAESLAIPLERATRWGVTTVWTKQTFTLEALTASLIALALEP